jgi:hypothetical protein
MLATVELTHTEPLRRRTLRCHEACAESSLRLERLVPLIALSSDELSSCRWSESELIICPCVRHAWYSSKSLLASKIKASQSCSDSLETGSSLTARYSRFRKKRRFTGIGMISQRRGELDRFPS